MSEALTVGQVAEIFGEPRWRIRRIVDSLGVEIPRAALYRLIPRALLPEIAAKLRERPPTPAEVAQ